MPDATGLELIAQDLGDAHSGSVLRTSFSVARAEILVAPATVHDVLEHLRDKGYRFLMSLHGVDYWPEEPRLGVVYELLDRSSLDRLSIKVRVTAEEPEVPTVVDIWPGADFPEREVFDMFGLVFAGHPDLRRILMPEDYEGHPQRRDFPTGGEPVLFTFNEEQGYGKYA